MTGSSRTFRRQLFAIATTLLAISILPVGADAASTVALPGLRASTRTYTTVVTPLTRRIEATVRLTAGSRRVGVGVDTVSPAFTRVNFGRPEFQGETLHVVRMRALSRIYGGYLYSGGGGGGDLGCSASFSSPQLPRGGNRSNTGRGLMIPPHRSVTLLAEFDVAGDTPWLGTDYTPGFRLVPIRKKGRGFEDGPSRPKNSITIKKPVVIKTVSPAVVGPFAARIDMNSIPQLTALGQPAQISGSLVPPIPGRVINLDVDSADQTGVTTPSAKIATVVTDGAGNFSYSGWSPPKDAIYSITPSYPEQDGGLLPDVGCPTQYFPLPQNTSNIPKLVSRASTGG